MGLEKPGNLAPALKFSGLITRVLDCPGREQVLYGATLLTNNGPLHLLYVAGTYYTLRRAIRTSRDSITQLQYLLPTLQVMRYRTRMQGSLPADG